MTKLELAVINNYIEWLETPANRKLKLKLINVKGAFLLKQWQEEKNVDKETAQEEISKLVISTLYSEDTWKNVVKRELVLIHYNRPIILEDGGAPIKLKLIEPILDDGKGCITKLHLFGKEEK